MWLVREREREDELIRQNVDENSDKLNENNDNDFRISLWRRLYYNKIFRALIVILAVAVIVPILILIFLDITDLEIIKNHSCSVDPHYRIPCGIQNVTYEECSKIKCCYNEKDFSCFHYLPSYYWYSTKTSANYSNLYFPVEEKTPFLKNNEPVYMYVTEENEHSLLIEYRTSRKEKKASRKIFSNKDYQVKVYENVMAVEVNRKSNNNSLISTAHGPTIVSARFWEITIDLYADYLAGPNFLKVQENETISSVFYKNIKEHNSVPKFIAYNNGSFHGLEVVHEGPLEVTVLPSKLIILRLFSGDFLNVRLTTGPTPLDIYIQQKSNIGFSMPYWALGVHICREGNSAKYLEEFYELLDNKNNSDILYESDCLHQNIVQPSWEIENIEYIKAAVKTLQEKKPKKRFVLSLAPQVEIDSKPYIEAKELEILYKRSGILYEGLYLDKNVSYPDYSTNDAGRWFQNIYEKKLKDLNPDGFVLGNDWPKNENNDAYFGNEFQVLPKNIWRAMIKTIPWDCENPKNTEHIVLHNFYGCNFASTISKATNKTFILSASFSVEKSMPSHVQNVDTSWKIFKEMLVKSLTHSFFAGPLLSVPVCGSTTNFSKEINQAVCLRWYLTASTLPIFRISSDLPRRDPTLYNDNLYAKQIMLNAIRTRYSLLPYFYTVLSENLPLIRPMFFDFPLDEEVFELDEQYMLGNALLVAQPTIFPVPNIMVYLPEVPGGWYEFWSGDKLFKSGWFITTIIEDDLPIFLASGHIIPMQNEPVTTSDELQNRTYKLIIGLYCTKKMTSCSAKGNFVMEDIGMVEFLANENSLTVNNAKKCDVTHDFRIINIRVSNSDNTTYFKVEENSTKWCFENDSQDDIEFPKKF